VPLVISGDIPGHEIEHPMAIVILGGLATSTVLNLFIVPSLYLRFGKSKEKDQGEQGKDLLSHNGAGQNIYDRVKQLLHPIWQRAARPQ